jgi:hypothetical protein
VCRAIEERDEGRPTLSELRAAVAISPHHLQRVRCWTASKSTEQKHD